MQKKQLRNTLQPKMTLQEQRNSLPTTETTQENHTLESLPLTHSQYNQLLSQWISFQQTRSSNLPKWQQNYINNNKSSKNVGITNVCGVCSGELNDGCDWCRVCGEECCKQCLVRLRVLQENNEQAWEKQQSNIAVPTCQNCDKKYLKALIELQDQKLFDENSKLLSELQQFYEEPQNPFTISPPSIKHPQSLRKMISIDKTQSSLDNSDTAILQALQLYKKGMWCESVQQKFEKKRKLLKKANSFSSFVNKSYDILESKTSSIKDLDIISNSFSASVLEDDTVLVIRKKCCIGCSIM